MYEVAEVVGAFWAGSINNSYYDNTRKHHNNGVGQKPENDTTGLSDTEMKEQAFVDQLNENRQGNTAYVEWKPDEGQENNGYPVFAAEPYSEPEALSLQATAAKKTPTASLAWQTWKSSRAVSTAGKKTRKGSSIF